MPGKIAEWKLSRSIAACTVISLLIATSAYGQRNYLFENISTPEGLSNSEVHSIFQDSHGFLWISTADGLNRYDGNTIRVFRNDPGDAKTLPNNNCFSIAEDADGFIWVAVSGNIIARFDPKDETFSGYPIETRGITSNSEFYSALYDSKGNLWFGSTNHGLQRLNRTTGQFEQVNVDSADSNDRFGQIYCIIELTNGTLLIADYGKGIKVYNEKIDAFQPYYLGSDYSPDEIDVIYEDTAGTIWFGGRSRLIRYNPADKTYLDYDVFSLIDNPTLFDNVTGITQDQEGYIWVTVYRQGLFRINLLTGEIRLFNYSPDDIDIARRVIWQLFRDKYGVIWLGTWGTGLTKFDPLREPFNYSKFRSGEIVSSKINFVTAIHGTNRVNEIIAGTSRRGLFSYNLMNNESLHLAFSDKSIGNADREINIQGLAVDLEGNIWFSYNNSGLHKIDRFMNLHTIDSPDKGKSTTYTVSSVKIDPAGSIWLASQFGFEKYDPVEDRFSLVPNIMNKQMSGDLHNQIHAVAASREPLASILKVGEASNLEKKFTLDSDQKILLICVGEGTMTQGLDGTWDKGNLLASDGQVVWGMNDLSRTFYNGGGFKNRIALKCVELKKGDYKISYSTDVGHSYGKFNVAAPQDSAWYGIQLLKISDDEYKSINDLNEKEIISGNHLPMEHGSVIEFSKKYSNLVWLGSMFNSFFRYDLHTGDYKQFNMDTLNKFSPNNSINCIFEDRKGMVWIATKTNLLRLDPETERIEKFDQRNGLSSNEINALIEDLQGNLWISTSGGLSKLNKNDPAESWNFVNFDARDGLPASSSSKAIWISPDGAILVGSNDGITSFYPGKSNEVKPDIVMADIKISDVSLKSDSTAAALQESIMTLDELKLSHTQNNISFEFASINFSRPGKNKVIYKLEGFNDHWVSSDRNFASYTNLAPGKYRFLVKGSNGDGVWNEEGKSIQIIISPPWWKTILAYISYGVLFFLIVFGIDRVQRRRILEKQRALAKDKELGQAREIEKAYTELKSTQAQLIQSEKMASLGELTAGIAHEIQNPLNFVNNFSDLSVDLIDELTEEIEKGNLDEIRILKKDLKQNLEKISQHGKRASSIVQGMLEHSRAGSGEKRPTDINALADEYLRLAYHGLRAKDKSFNSDYKTDFDVSIPRIYVVPQDIGRVFLNLINNAFYAVSEKVGQDVVDFQPCVVFSSKLVNNTVEMGIRDNGNGMPESIKEKIFQPFFTTKPTGQGTGLGLSLSYDIIKAHGGNIKVHSETGQGTAFTIQLPLK
jgi:signal transduction histidine kinase/ligand-binding sensor domain-containing protein